VAAFTPLCQRPTNPLIIDPNSLAAEIARILSVSRLPDLPAVSKTGSPHDPVPPELQQDSADLLPLLQFDSQAEKAASVLNQVAASVSYRQTQDALLAKIGTVLDRMLELSRLSLQPGTTDNQRIGLAAEFGLLQKEITTVAAKQFNGQPLFSQNATDWIALKYGFPAAVATGWNPLLDKIKAEERHRKNQPKRTTVHFPKISVVIILSGNASDAPMLLSVLEQDYPNLECIVLGSSTMPETGELIERYNKNIVFHSRREHDTPAHALHEGCRRSTGEILAFLDRGDQLLPHSLQTAGSAFLKNREMDWLVGHPCALREQGLALTATLPMRSHEDFLAGRVSGLLRKGCFWRRSLWERSASGLRNCLLDAADFCLWLNFYKISSPHSVTALLCGALEQRGNFGSSFVPEQNEQPGLAAERQRLDAARQATRSPAPILRLHARDVLPFAAQPSLDTLVMELEGEMRAENWTKARAHARKVAAIQPASPDLQRLHALCESNAGRLPQAQAILQNLAFRFPDDSASQEPV
jgi:hypothetical protein